MTSTKTIPQLPVELVAEIISTTWHMPLSQRERITFMRSSALVNSTWADIFDLVSSRDVYIPSAAFCDHFIHRLRLRQPALAAPSTYSFFGMFLRRSRGPAKQPMPTANLACQSPSTTRPCGAFNSLTIQIINEDVYPGVHTPMRLPMGGVLESLLETLDAWSLAPNLRRLSIEYHDTGFDDIFTRVGLAALPPQIAHLDVRYSFSDTMPPWLVEAVRRKKERRRRFGWNAPAVTRLSVFGAGENTVRDLRAMCPNAQIVNL
ncbi:hypothetical protein B0H12DRAFT_1079900 [Mycena haematopus]|nr:hypothetical protein B0H12DRAFT_1079900 [Mycena haematopus]